MQAGDHAFSCVPAHLALKATGLAQPSATETCIDVEIACMQSPSCRLILIRTLVKGQIIHAGIEGISVAVEISWRKLESKLLQASLSLDVSSCTEAGPVVAVVIEEAAARRL